MKPELRYTRRRARTSGKYLRVWMRKLGLSYADVAQGLGVHEITVRNWEKQKLIRVVVKLAFDHVFRSKPKHRVYTPFPLEQGGAMDNRFPGEWGVK